MDSRTRSSETHPVEVVEKIRENGKEMTFENKMADNFSEMK